MKTIKYFLAVLSLLVGGSYLNAQCSTAPIINSFSPNTGFIGSTVTITGANFDANNINNNVVFFGATKATVTQASFGQLKVIVPVGASTDRISVTNQCNLTAYSKVPFNGIFCPTPLDGQTYQNNAQILGVSYGAYNMIAVDLDLDGRAEVISSGTGTGVSIAKNNSSPGSINFSLLNFGLSAGTIYTADLDGDGRKDVIGRYYSHLNTSTPGNISFGASASNQNVSSYQIAAGDFNNDGKIDVVGEYGNHLYIARNLSTGPGNLSFEARQLIQANIGRATGIQTADVDGDGKIDILISQGNYNRAMTFRNTTPTGSNVFTFEAGEIWSTGGTYPYRCQIADFNKDGKIDFTTCNYTGTHNTAVLINRSTPGNIDMSGLINMPSFVNNYRIQVGDVDGDGYPDIVTKSLGVNQFAVYRNTTTSPTTTSFANPIYYSSSAQAEVSGIVIGDLDGDYVPDIATSGISSNQIRFHRNTSAQVDNTAPTAICQNVILALGPDGTATLTPEMVDNGSSDACGLGGITISQTAFNCSHIGPNSVTMIVTDVAGNSDSCVATVNVQPAAIIAAGQTTVCQGETVTLNANAGDSYQWKLNGVNIAGATNQQYIATTSGDYTVIVTNALGCSGESLPTTVVVNNNPTVGITPAGTAYMCNGSAELTATESAIYQWQLNGTDIPNATQQIYNASVAGNYSVQVIDLFGCSASSNVVTVSSGAPVIGINHAGTAVANGDNTPSAAEGTDFGQVTPNTPYTRTFTISNSGNVDLSVSDIYVDGLNASQFSISASNAPFSIGAGQSATFDVIFNGSQLQSYFAQVHVVSNDCNNGSYVFDVQAEIVCSPVVITSNVTTENYSAGPQCGAPGTYAIQVDGLPAPSVSYVFTGATTGSGAGDGSGSIFNVGTTQVTVTGSNACNSESISFDVVVTDDTAPTVAVQGLTLSLDANGQASISASQVDNGSFDNCGVASISVSPATFDCNDLGQGGTVTVSSDASWKKSTFETPSPWGTLPMPSIQGSLPAASTYTNSVSNVWPYNGSLVFSPAIPNALPIFANGGWQFFRNTFALNGSPNSMRIRLNVDNLAEVFINGQKVVYENNYNNSANFNGGAYHDILIDENGVQNGYQGGDVYDVVSVANIAGLLQQGTNEIVVAVANANGTDQGGLQFRMDMEYTSGVPVTVTVTDNSGNSSTATAIVSVVDDQAPVLSCPADINVSTDPGACSAVVNYNVGATDNCGVTVTYSHASGSAFPTGTTVVTATAVDPSGNTSTCSFNVTVSDTEAPTVVCPGNQTIDLDANCSAVLPDYTSLIVATDNCSSNISISQSPAAGSFSYEAGNITVNFLIVDEAGNVSTCSLVVEKNDVTAPVMNCPSPIAVNNEPGACGATVTFATPSATDNCSSGSNSGTNTLVYGQSTYDYDNNIMEPQYSPGLPITFLPTHGNKMAVFLQRCSSQHYLYQNVTVPTTGNQTLELDMAYNNHYSGGFSNNQFVAIELRDPYTGALINTLFKTVPGSPQSTPMTHYSFNIGAHAGQLVQLRVINATVNNFYFDVLLDNVTLPNSNLVNGSFETGDYTGWVAHSINGSCGTFGIGEGPGLTVNQIAGLASGSTFPVGTTINTFEVVDAAGNATTCSFDVTVNDVENPTLACPSNIQSLATSAAGAVVNYNAPVANDNCGIASTTLITGVASGGTFPIGVTTVTYETTDLSGNTATCSFDVEILGLPPVAECPGNITQTADAGQCGAVVTFAAVDNTGIPASTMTYSHAPGSFFPVGTTTVTATATNAVGSSSCTFDVTVTDDESPVLTVPANIAVSNDAGICGAAVSFAASATDNCGVNIAYSHVSGDVYPVGTTTVTVTATDIHGNVTSGSFDITVTDDEDPVLTIPADITVSNDAGVCGAAVSYTASATDNCGVSLSYSHNSGDVFPVGTTTVTVTATDIHGNAVSNSFDVTVNDTELPVVVTQDFTVTLANATASVSTADIDAGSTDNCGILNMSVSPNTWGCGDIGDHTVTLSVKDIHGNINTSTATVHVLGDVPSCSIVSIPSNNTFTGGDPNVLYLGYGAQSTTLSATATGGSGFTYSWSGQNLSSTTSANPVFTPTSDGNYSFTCTVTNSNGCTSTCEISICVFDIRVPKKNNKVYVCKVPPGNPSNTHTIQVSVNAVAAHLNTGSYLGDCSMGSCSSLSQKVINGEIARSENEWSREVLVYPNPNDGNFNVYVSTDSDEAIQIEVMDMTGKIIQNSSAEPNLVKEMFMDVTPGVYMIKVTQGEYVQNIRLVKN